MATEAQILANRLNAQKSTGPHMQKVLEIRSITMFLCASVPLWLKLSQSKMINYAKQTQFSKKSNVYNRNCYNGLQRKMHNGHLVKTNPNEPKFTRHSVWRANPIRL
jgi:hypothetical protein